jgi:tetratricopeptide (TPR) repeat protein
MRDSGIIRKEICMRLSVLLLAAITFSSPSLAQPPAPRQLFEAGQHEQALEAVAQQRQLGAANPADTYLAVQSLVKLGRPDQAKAELAQLEGSGDEIWKLIARSASALIDGNVGPALDAANQAAAASPGSFFAQYQLGLVRAQQEDWAGAADAFERASQIDPMFAYTHYNAGVAYSKVDRADRMASHFQTFVKLAPKAPERVAVESILRTLRGR